MSPLRRGDAEKLRACRSLWRRWDADDPADGVLAPDKKKSGAERAEDTENRCSASQRREFRYTKEHYF